jgi:imidazole glycerol-phosphate synthase subunit HisF
MLNTRVIPCLLLQDRGLVKTTKFKDPVYVGDPVNAVKIFNEKEVDELIFLDIDASKRKTGPNLSLISELATECFMPFAYGGGITDIEQIRSILKLGVEKVIINKSALDDLSFIVKAEKEFGRSTLIVAIDIKKNLFGKYKVYDHARKKVTDKDPVEYAKAIEQAGAGEIFLNNVDRDGTFAGFDNEIIKRITSIVSVPVIVCGGAASLQDFKTVVKDGGASAVSAGSFFVFQGPHRAVLISYPQYSELRTLFGSH